MWYSIHTTNHFYQHEQSTLRQHSKLWNLCLLSSPSNKVQAPLLSHGYHAPTASKDGNMYPVVYPRAFLLLSVKGSMACEDQASTPVAILNFVIKHQGYKVLIKCGCLSYTCCGKEVLSKPCKFS